MALNGPQALQSLDDALRDIRREEDEVTKRLARSAELVAKFRETEADLFRQLALLRLAPDIQAELVGRLTRAEDAARDLMAEHQGAVSETAARVKALDDTIATLATERKAVLADTEAQQAELGALSERISEATLRDPEHRARREQAEAMRAIAEEALRKAEQAEQDSDEKTRSYREDPMFSYLWDLGYGTPQYRAGGLQRWLDGMVARLIGYQDARPNFAMLNELPLRLREHAERQLENAETADAALDSVEAEAIDRAGGKTIREALAATQARLSEIDAELLALEDQRDDQAEHLRQLAEGDDPAFGSAITQLSENLEREDLKRLLDDARSTRTPEDDAILVKIDEARLRASEEESEAKEQKERLKTLAARRRDLEDIEWEFKRARFDDPRSSFRDDNLVGDLLDAFLRGSMSATVYWEHWRSSQDWTDSGTEWGGGLGAPRRNRDPWDGGSSRHKSGGGASGGFSRPRSRAGGSRKSGGFRTGGGF